MKIEILNEKIKYLKDKEITIDLINFIIPNRNGNGYIGKYNRKIVIPFNFKVNNEERKEVILFDCGNHFKAFDFEKNIDIEIEKISYSLRGVYYNKKEVYKCLNSLVIVNEEKNIYTERLNKYLCEELGIEFDESGYWFMKIDYYNINDKIIEIGFEELGDLLLTINLDEIRIKNNKNIKEEIARILEDKILNLRFIEYKPSRIDNEEYINKIIEDVLYELENQEWFIELMKINEIENQIQEYKNPMIYEYSYRFSKRENRISYGLDKIEFICPICGEENRIYVYDKEFKCSNCNEKYKIKNIKNNSEFNDSWESKNFSNYSIDYKGIIKVEFENKETQEIYQEVIESQKRINEIENQIKKDKVKKMINEYVNRFGVLENFFEVANTSNSIELYNKYIESEKIKDILSNLYSFLI